MADRNASTSLARFAVGQMAVTRLTAIRTGQLPGILDAQLPSFVPT
jgi:hypothetical protein